ncbi:family 43 glycosylhydrolase [Oerskovia flava]|uniref:family 43 glycosylhydrolase n=1 Tax=Oerskovia flava TaxID=2986422 RepID=UPI002240753C|nr:family 43 glycosylhydrolase [Oerskovia sp. JB1-3-2]
MTSRHEPPPTRRRMPRRVLGGLLGLTLTAPLLTAPATAAPAPTLQLAAAPSDGLRLWLPLDETEGTVAHDESGNGLDATLTGAGGGWRAGQGLEFGGSNHVELVDDLLADLDAVTVSADVWIDTSLTGNYFFYNLGNAAVGTPQSGTGYLFSTGNANYRATISDVAWGREQNTVKAPAGALARGVWKTVTYTLADGTARLYEDGAQVGENAAVTHTPGAIGGGSTTANFLGKSAYAADGLFKGRMKDFRLYERALSAQEVADVAADAAAGAVTADAAALDLGDTSAVVADLALPARGAGGSAVAWESSDTSVVATDGRVTRPAENPTTVTLTATVTLRGASETRTFDVTVLPGEAGGDDQVTVDAAAAALEVTNLDDVRGHLTLPTTGLDGTSVTWAASSGTITPTGEVTRPAHGEEAETVTLTATVTLGDAVVERTFEAHVPPLPQDEELEGYLFSYFIGEGTADGEQVYFGLSKGNDPLRYIDLNDNQPVLTSELGDEGLRDPFIIRSPEGDKFYQIATDLKVHGSWDWDGFQRRGSKSIMVWESTDLVNWTDQRLVQVSPENAGNTWAPEAYYDETIGAYVVFWASKLYAEDDPNHTGNTYNRMMYSTTRDFVTFTDPQVWVDPGYSVIDSTVMLHDGEYYRFTKDERNNTSSTPCSKFIIGEKSSELRSTDYEFITDCIGRANSLGAGINQGEGPTIFKSNTEEKWYMFIDEFGGRGYVPFETTDLDAAEWKMSTGYEMPSRPRHGTVLPVTQAEYDRLLQTYQPDAFVEAVDDVEVTVQVGSAPVLPSSVTARFADGSTGPADVTWDAVDAASFAQAGVFVVEGSLGGGVSVRARAVVTVTDDVVPVEGLSVTPASAQVGIGGTRQLVATVSPANATARAITWASEDPDVVTISADGLVTGVGEGTAMVTATTADGEHTVYVAVEVTADVPGLVVRYALDETSGTSAANSAPGSSFGAAALVNGAAFTGDEGVALDGTNDYVDLPDHVLAGLTDISVSLDVKIAAAQATPYFIYGMGNTSGTTGDGYLFTTGNAYRTSIATGNWSTEQTVTKGSNLDRGVWKHLTYTLEGTTATLYEDGVQVGRQTGVTINPQDIGGGSTLANYIGRSVYTGDRYLQGNVRDFRIYDRALTADEVAAVGADHTAVTGAELDTLKVPAVVHAASSTVTLPVEPGTDLTALAPELTVSALATVTPANGSVQDFTDPVEYTVAGPGGASRTWSVQAKIMNSPSLPGLYADPNIVQFGDTFYIYATSDGYAGWGGKEFYVWKSSDLVDWERSEEPFLTLDGANGNVPWATGNAWAPTIAEREGKYYFYFSGHNPTYNRKTIGVAVADSPEGPFTAEPTAMITNGESIASGQAIDPATFHDPETGKYWLLWGNGGPTNGPVMAELNDDMTSIKQDTLRRIPGLTGFREGLFVNLRGGLYHLTYSIDDTGSENYRVGYATATSMEGPWTYRGVILEKDATQGLLGTGHSSILNVKGTDDWYIAYHRFAMPGGNGTNRETTIDRLTFGEDGLMLPVTPTLEGVQPLDAAPQPEVEMTVEVAPRCVAGRVYLAVSATNAGDVPATITLATPFGSRTVADVAPGKVAYQAFTTRSASLTAGTATVAATALLDGEEVTTVRDVEYDASTC